MFNFFKKIINKKPVENNLIQEYWLGFEKQTLKWFETEIGEIKSCLLAAECDLNDIDLVTKNFMRYVGHIPASQHHHHSRNKGLFMHSLEVAFFACTDSACGTYMNQFPEKQRKYAYLVIFICALLHDLGKILTDIAVYINGSSGRWNPLLESLFDYSIRLGSTDYKVIYERTHDHHEHQKAGAMLYAKLLGDEIIGKLESRNFVFIRDLSQFMCGQHVNALSEIILAADRLSVKMHLRNSPYRFSLSSDGSLIRPQLDTIPVLREIRHIMIYHDNPAGIYNLSQGVFIDIN